MAKTQELINLAKNLPPKLCRFFARYPPPSIVPPDRLKGSTPETKYRYVNPFKATRDPITARWHNPVFSLRRQADLVKLAQLHGVEELLPPTVKGTKEKIRRKLKYGNRIKGTGVGQKVKGKAHERTMKSRLEKRKQAMLAMPQMIQTWKREVTVADGKVGRNKISGLGYVSTNTHVASTLFLKLFSVVFNLTSVRVLYFIRTRKLSRYNLFPVTSI